MAKKNISRERKRELEAPDGFIVFFNKLLQFIIRNKTNVVTGLVVFFLIIIGISGMAYYAGKTENRASLLVAKSINKYHDLLKIKGPENAFEDVEKEFEMIIEKYNRKHNGKFAGLFFANICFTAKKYEKAIEHYKQSLRDFENDDSIKNLILSSIGYSYEQTNDFKTAAIYFEMITSKPDVTKQDEAFFNTGILYAKMGDYDKSAKCFQKIIDDHKDSIYFELVKEKTASLYKKKADQDVAGQP